MMPRLRPVLLSVALMSGLTACSFAPRYESENGPLTSRAAGIASGMVGKPYRYGGNSPYQGFDCSGLVFYSYRKAGLEIPRSTDEQRHATRRIAASHLAPGDLLFFDQDGKRFSHVGVYIGGSRFVHAPSRGQTVRIDTLDDPYWDRYFSDARRF